jgi:hypothetical protein
MTVHRAVSVVKPHLVDRILTPRRVIAINVAVVVVMAAIFTLTTLQVCDKFAVI